MQREMCEIALDLVHQLVQDLGADLAGARRFARLGLACEAILRQQGGLVGTDRCRWRRRRGKPLRRGVRRRRAAGA